MLSKERGSFYAMHLNPQLPFLQIFHLFVLASTIALMEVIKNKDEGDKNKVFIVWECLQVDTSCALHLLVAGLEEGHRENRFSMKNFLKSFIRIPDLQGRKAEKMLRNKYK